MGGNWKVSARVLSDVDIVQKIGKSNAMDVNVKKMMVAIEPTRIFMMVLAG